MKKKVFRYLRWLIGITVLIVVFKQIDLLKLKEFLLRSNYWLIALGLLHSPLLILVGSVRWQYILAQFFKPKLATRSAIVQYWSGVAIGFFTPASLGLDAYRVIYGGNVYGSYTINAIAIIIEKILALITCASLFVVLYPIVPISINNQLMTALYVAFFIMICFLTALLFSKAIVKSHTVMRFISKLDTQGARILKKISQKYAFNSEKVSLSQLLNEVTRALSFFKISNIIAFTLAIQFITSLKSQIFFTAIGYDLPFLVNLFVAPTLYFIFMLPISFGSLGIREGVYIVMYALFGVPAEIALIVSFFNLIGMALNNLIGAVIMMFAKRNENLGIESHEKFL